MQTEGKREIIKSLPSEYDIQSAEDIEEALKDLPGGIIKEMMEAEMDHHLGYEKSERSDSDDYRNGYKSKTVKSRFGKMGIEVPHSVRDNGVIRKLAAYVILGLTCDSHKEVLSLSVGDNESSQNTGLTC